jgi:heptosyltransferase-2
MKVFDKVAVIKPDHVGDLILSVPAIGRIADLASETTLFVAGSNVTLARHLFPQVEVRRLDFPHLAKGGTALALPLGELQRMFRPFSIIFALRSDAILNRQNLEALGPPVFLTKHLEGMHVTSSHAECLYGVIGHYDSEAYWPGRASAWPSRIIRVALVVGAGFPANRWSGWYWARLARLVEAKGQSPLLIGGPAERDFVAAIARIAGLSDQQVMYGSPNNIPDLLARLATCDVAIASDGGSGHLASLACPVLSLFTSSPYRRFAPFGRENRLITLDLPCSPCLNAHEELVNLCLTHECSFGVLPETVVSAMDAPCSPPGTWQSLDDPYGARLVYGISHS